MDLSWKVITFVVLLVVNRCTAIDPTSAPTEGFNLAEMTDCWEWVVGYSRGSCTETCAEVGRTCAEDHLGDINSIATLEAALNTSFLLGSAVGPGSIASFCDGGVNIWPFATAPAAFAYQTFVPNPNDPTNGVYKTSHYCYFPTVPGELQGDCDTTYIIPPAQRICSCYNGGCPPTLAPTTVPTEAPTAVPTAVPTEDPTVLPTEAPSLAVVASAAPSQAFNVSQMTDCWEWVVGYSRGSCTETCADVGRTCAEDHLSEIDSIQALEAALSNSFLLGSAVGPGSVAQFCDGGVNIWPFATAPAAFAYQTFVPDPQDPSQGVYKISHYCYFPTAPGELQGDCDTTYIIPPAQRICSCWKGDCDNPSAQPTVAPTVEVTVAPTVEATVPGNCLEWVLGYSKESCSLTCSRLSRECRESQLATIVTQAAFYSMVASATDLESNAPAGSATAFCNMGTNVYTFAPVPAAYTYVLCTSTGDVEQTYCNFPTSVADLGGDCDSAYVYPPAQRFCPCTLGDCPIEPTCNEWVLGYSTESCTLTCGRVSGVCDPAGLASIVTQQAFYDMVAVATPIDASCPTGGNALTFCTQGINTYQFAQAPAAFSYLTHNVNGEATETYCNYPTSLASLNADCDAAYVYPPSRRFCSCTVTNCAAAAPSVAPSVEPSVVPTEAPSAAPTVDPTTVPSAAPTETPTAVPSAVPSAVPTVDPSVVPTEVPSAVPSVVPTKTPSAVPSATPSAVPTASPTVNPTTVPSAVPSAVPTVVPSPVPSATPTKVPTVSPSAAPSAVPSQVPTVTPTASPSVVPTFQPTAQPTLVPSAVPSAAPSAAPTVLPSAAPTVSPSAVPTAQPSAAPTVVPSAVPSTAPSAVPTVQPSAAPTVSPSAVPTVSPSAAPTVVPSAVPSTAPSAVPTVLPSVKPTASPSVVPTVSPSAAPTIKPSAAPSIPPTRAPTRAPTVAPTRNPTGKPTAAPSGCFKWVVGYSEMSCTTTCSDPEVGTGGVCENGILQTIDTLADFSAVVSSALLLGSGGSSPGDATTFCNSGINVFNFATSPAAFAYQQYVADPTPHYIVNNYCYFPGPGANTATCDTVYNYPPSQRICACRVASCTDTGAYPYPNFRRLEEEETAEGEDVQGQVTNTPVVEVLSTPMVTKEVLLPTASEVQVSSVSGVSAEVLLVLVGGLQWQYQAALAAAVVGVLLCMAALGYTLTLSAKPAPSITAGGASPSKGVTWAASVDASESAMHSVNASASTGSMRSTRNHRKREVYIDMPQV